MNCLNHDFHKIFRIIKIYIGNLINLVKIVVQIKKCIFANWFEKELKKGRYGSNE